MFPPCIFCMEGMDGLKMLFNQPITPLLKIVGFYKQQLNIRQSTRHHEFKETCMHAKLKLLMNIREHKLAKPNSLTKLLCIDGNMTPQKNYIFSISEPYIQMFKYHIFLFL